MKATRKTSLKIGESPKMIQEPDYRHKKREGPEWDLLFLLGGRRDSNPRHSEPQSDALTN